MKKYSRKILETPETLVSGGNFNNGTFSRPFKILNPLDARCYPVPLPRIIKKFRLKEWQAYEMGNDHFFIFVVLYNAKSMGLVQFFVYDRLKCRKMMYQKMIPAYAVKLPSSLYNSTGHYKAKNFTVEYNNNIDNNLLEVNIKIINYDKTLPDINATFCGQYNFNKWEPVVVSLPFSEKRSLYSHKCLMPMSGSISIGKDLSVFKPGESYMIIDDQKSYYPFISGYDWATGVQYSKKHPLTGFNLTANQVINPELYNENCLWLKGRIHPLPPVKFSRPHGVDNMWLIHDDFGMVDIRFIPEIQGKVDVNLLIFKSYYRGPLGKFYGFIKDSSGKKHIVDDYFGMGEMKRLRL